MPHLIKATGKNADKKLYPVHKFQLNPHSMLHKERIANNR